MFGKEGLVIAVSPEARAFYCLRLHLFLGLVDMQVFRGLSRELTAVARRRATTGALIIRHAIPALPTTFTEAANTRFLGYSAVARKEEDEVAPSDVKVSKDKTWMEPVNLNPREVCWHCATWKNSVPP